MHDRRTKTKTTFEDLWYTYLIDKKTNTSIEESRLINLIDKNEENLRKTLKEGQIELFLKYDDSVTDLNMYNEKNAFLKGVHFATMFLIETIQLDM